jgi:hypothetical protein
MMSISTSSTPGSLRRISSPLLAALGVEHRQAAILQRAGKREDVARDRRR